MSEYMRVPSSEPANEELKRNCEARIHPRSTVKILLGISILFSIVGILKYLSLTPNGPVVEHSAFAGLTWTIPRKWGPNQAINDSEQDILWEATNYDKGNIALLDSYAREQGLPRAQRFPWDREKGIYLINAYHNLHCVKTLRTALVNFRDGNKQSSPWDHLVHCLLVLREEIMCHADDTPRYTGFQPDQKSGLGQVRMCRDFDALERWAQEHTACWRHVGDADQVGFRELDRYRFCPRGSQYKKASETLWLKSDWWKAYKDDS